MLTVALGNAGCEHRDNPLRPEARDVETPSADREIVIVSRAPDVPTYPCVEQCHVDLEPNATPREMASFHRRIVIDHAAVMHFCDACHFLEDVDGFQLIDGTRVDFEASDRVCGQCHGEKHRDWARGVHGIQTGSWREETHRRTCTACHDPHAPLEGIRLNALPVPENARGGEG